jgi:hypothetical protein
LADQSGTDRLEEDRGNRHGGGGGGGDDVSDAGRLWWASYRYNPDHTQQPTPSAPPAIIRGISAKIAAASGQVCNHAVCNRYCDGRDSIGAHGDKALDLADDSYIVSVSFGAARVMTFEPKYSAPALDGRGGVVQADDVKSARRAFVAALSSDTEWREIAAAKAAAAPMSEAKAAAVARERERGALLRASDPVVAAAAAKAKSTREAWRAAKTAARWHLTLEPGSALFFNMAFNDRCTHAIHAVPIAGSKPIRGGTENNDEGLDEGDDDDDDKETKTDDEETKGPVGSAGHDSGSGGYVVGERIGVTLRRCHTVFDPVRQAGMEGRSRAWRKGIWRPLRDMGGAHEAEASWREG